jgi:hypothetical protein
MHTCCCSCRLRQELSADDCNANLLGCCRGLFEEHKLLFSFLLCTSILRHPSSGQITEAEWSFLTRGAPSGSAAAAAAASGGPQPPTWLPDGAWGKLKALEVAVPLFKGITESLVKHEGAWKAWCVPPAAACTTPFKSNRPQTPIVKPC